MPKEIDHSYTKDIICPHCGYEVEDSWELSCDDGKLTCDDCEKEFSYERVTDITYTTYAETN